MSKTNTPSLMTMRGPHDWLPAGGGQAASRIGVVTVAQFQSVARLSRRQSVMRLISCGWLSYEVKDGTRWGQPSDRLQAFIRNHLCPRRWLCIELTNIVFFFKRSHIIQYHYFKHNPITQTNFALKRAPTIQSHPCRVIHNTPSKIFAPHTEIPPVTLFCPTELCVSFGRKLKMSISI